MTHNIILSGLAALVVGVAGMSSGLFATRSADAQTAQAITATPAAQPDSYTIHGTGFTPGARVRVIEIRCGSFPCGAGGTANVVATASDDGTFEIVIQLEADDRPTDRDFRLIAAWEAFPDGTTRGGEATDPQVKVPLSHPGTPAPLPPNTGSGLQDAADGSPAITVLGVLGVLAIAASGSLVFAATRRNR